MTASSAHSALGPSAQRRAVAVSGTGRAPSSVMWHMVASPAPTWFRQRCANRTSAPSIASWDPGKTGARAMRLATAARSAGPAPCCALRNTAASVALTAMSIARARVMRARKTALWELGTGGTHAHVRAAAGLACACEVLCAAPVMAESHAVRWRRQRYAIISRVHWTALCPPTMLGSRARKLAGMRV